MSQAAQVGEHQREKLALGLGAALSPLAQKQRDFSLWILHLGTEDVPRCYHIEPGKAMKKAEMEPKLGALSNAGGVSLDSTLSGVKASNPVPESRKRRAI